MEDQGKDVVLNDKSIETMMEYEKNYQLIESKVKDINDAVTAAVTVNTTTDVAGAISTK